MTAVEESLAATRTLAADPATVFALLADPRRHRELNPGGFADVHDAVDGDPIAAAGQVFAVNMYNSRFGHYVMHNLVTVYEPDRAIAWLPGGLTATGDHDAAGWLWRYDLSPDGAGTAATLTFDWSRTREAVRAEVGGMPPPFPPGFLDHCLAALDDATGGRSS